AGAIVCRPDELAPIHTRCLPRGIGRRKLLHVFAQVLISKKGDNLAVSVDGDIFWLRDGIKIGDEWNGNPVIPTNSVVPADHHTMFSFVAPPQRSGRSRADTS